MIDVKPLLSRPESPGSFPFPLTVDDLKAGVSRVRNPVIARVLRELDFMEEWGTGYVRISKDCEEGGYPVPEWTEMGAVTRLVFRPHPEYAEGTGVDVGVNGQVVGVSVGVDDHNVGVNDRDVGPRVRQAWFLERLRKKEQIRPSDVARHFGISSRTAERDVADLVKQGRVKYSGPPKTGLYRLTENSGS